MCVYTRAKKMALQNSYPYHLAAILWRGNTPIRIGINSSKTDPANRREFPNGQTSYAHHAEMAAIKKAQPGDRLEVFRFNRAGEYRTSKPCPDCMARIKAAGISRLTFINSDHTLTTVRL